ncbi:MAG: CDP-archaeol synthase [Candidatus Saccharimonadales bacterium]
MYDILFSLWFFLPAGIANAAPIIASRLPVLKNWSWPIDGGRRYRGIRIFGPHKTWRGLLVGAMAGGLVFVLQAALSDNLGSFTNYLDDKEFTMLPLWFGAVLGFGALAGDAIESFFKRQRHIKSGEPWLVLDQVDYIIGACLLSLLFIQFDWHIYALILLNWFVLHIIFSYLGYRLHLKNSPI